MTRSVSPGYLTTSTCHRSSASPVGPPRTASRCGPGRASRPTARRECGHERDLPRRAGLDTGPRARSSPATAATPPAWRSATPAGRPASCSTPAPACARCRGCWRDAPFQGTLLLTHLHWDHLQGLPFCANLDCADADVRLYLPEQDGTAREVLSRMMSPPFFPIAPDGLQGAWSFRSLEEGTVELDGFEVTACEVPHPGGRTFGYRVSDGRVVARLHPRSPADRRRLGAGGLGRLRPPRARPRRRRRPPRARRPVPVLGAAGVPPLGPQLGRLRRRAWAVGAASAAWRCSTTPPRAATPRSTASWPRRVDPTSTSSAPRRTPVDRASS